MIKLEEGKYYRTADGRKVGPVRIANLDTSEWALWSDRKYIYEVVGLPREGSCGTKIVAEWTDQPKLWRDMTPEEKGALLLAHHEGKVIEANEGDGWFDAHPYWAPNSAYRVRPEPKREVAKLYAQPGYRITFDLVDGEPDCASIKMERIDD